MRNDANLDPLKPKKIDAYRSLQARTLLINTAYYLEFRLTTIGSARPSWC